MDRLVRLARLWDWLPVFRAVAETEHLHRAAKRLATSPSAVSRTIRLLEEGIGAPLFRRIGRALTLADLGRELLGATRDAMRLVDGVIARDDAAVPGESSPRLRIGCTSTAATLLATLGASLLLEKVSFAPLVSSVTEGDAGKALLRGDLDVGLVTNATGLLADPSLTATDVGSATSGVFCGKGHPLYRRRAAPSVEDVLAHPFVVLTESSDGWTAAHPRIVGASVPDLHSMMSLCKSGRLLAVLPDQAVPGSANDEGRLCRIPLELLAPLPIVAVLRRRVGRALGLEERFIEVVRAALTASA